MAKKIRLDFSKAEDRASWNSKHMPPGLYEAEIAIMEETKAKDGTDMLIYGFRPTSPKYKTRNFPYYCKLQANQLWKLRDLFIAAGQTVPKKVVTLDPNKIVGKIVAIEIDDDTYDGKIRSVMEGVYDVELIEDEELSEDDVNDDGQDDFEEDEDFDEDDFEDDLEDDLDDSDDEDDLEEDFDEEDLDDDEEEDEEEEPAPVKKSVKKTPKRRVVKK